MPEKTSPKTAIAILASGVLALALSVLFINGAFEPTKPAFEPVALDTPVQPLDEPTNVDGDVDLDEMVIAIPPTSATPSATPAPKVASRRVSGPGAARIRTAKSKPLEVPGGSAFASPEALSYDPTRSHLTRSVHLRRTPGTVGQPNRAPKQEREDFAPIEERVGH